MRAVLLLALLAAASSGDESAEELRDEVMREVIGEGRGARHRNRCKILVEGLACSARFTPLPTCRLQLEVPERARLDAVVAQRLRSIIHRVAEDAPAPPIVRAPPGDDEVEHYKLHGFREGGAPWIIVDGWMLCHFRGRSENICLEIVLQREAALREDHVYGTQPRYSATQPQHWQKQGSLLTF